MSRGVAIGDILAGCRQSLGHHLADHLVLEFFFLLDIGDGVIVAEFGELGRGGDGVIETPEVVHQTELIGVRPAPDPALGHPIHLFGGHPT